MYLLILLTSKFGSLLCIVFDALCSMFYFVCLWSNVCCLCGVINDKNSSGDEIANVNFYAVRRKLLQFAQITQNNAITPFKVIQGHRFWYQSKAHIRFSISD